MKDRFFNEHAFRQWLVEENIVSNASAISYCSYVNSVNKQTDFNSELEPHVSSDVNINYTRFIEDIIQLLSGKDYPAKINKAPKTIQNWKSGLLVYGEFLAQNYLFTEDRTTTEPILKDCLLNNYGTSYTQEYLYKIFAFRLITQDRFYDELYFPISFIKRIFYKTGNKEYFNQWIGGILDKTVVHLENNQFSLQQIQNVYFELDSVKVDVGKKYYQVYTKLANNKDKSALVVKKLQNISLDHNKPMHKIIREFCGELKELQKITEIIKSKLGKRKVNRSVLGSITNELFSDFYLDRVDLEQLKKDLSVIAEQTDLQLMDSSLNSSKGVN